jgi:hypothetical protein
MLSLGAAAKLTGLGKTTLARSIKAGRLSATRRDDGSYQIDPSELHRVYPFLGPTEATDATVAATRGSAHYATGNDPTAIPMGVLETQITGLREVGELLRRQLHDRDRQLTDLRQDRDHWRSQAEATQRRLAGATKEPETPQTRWRWLRLTTRQGRR